MRNISFALTTEQFVKRQKTVTRRLGWEDLQPGELLCGVLKGMGLRPGEKIVRLGIIVVTDVTRETLNCVDDLEVKREGFHWLTPENFVDLFCKSHSRCTPQTLVTRIEFQYLPGGRITPPSDVPTLTGF